MPTSKDALCATKMLPRASESSSPIAGRSGPAPARSRSRMPVIWVMRGGIGMPGSTSREIRPDLPSPSSRTAPISTMRALAPTPGRLEVDDRPGRRFERRARRRREADESDPPVVVPYEARVVLHDLPSTRRASSPGTRGSARSAPAARSGASGSPLSSISAASRSAAPSSSWSGAARGPRGGGVRPAMRTYVRNGLDATPGQPASRGRRPSASSRRRTSAPSPRGSGPSDPGSAG